MTCSQRSFSTSHCSTVSYTVSYSKAKDGLPCITYYFSCGDTFLNDWSNAKKTVIKLDIHLHKNEQYIFTYLMLDGRPYKYNWTQTKH